MWNSKNEIKSNWLITLISFFFLLNLAWCASFIKYINCLWFAVFPEWKMPSCWLCHPAVRSQCVNEIKRVCVCLPLSLLRLILRWRHDDRRRRRVPQARRPQRTRRWLFTKQPVLRWYELPKVQLGRRTIWQVFAWTHTFSYANSAHVLLQMFEIPFSGSLAQGRHGMHLSTFL